jgi:hypothetical protein
MKNITDFNKFKEYKKLNEETYADPRAGSYGGGGDTYFANVKGNMAGWENTLIGAGVAKLFGFFRRKINEGILFLYKKALFREYLANVLRYAAKNDLNAENPNTLYKVKQTANIEGVETNGEEIEVKFTNEKKLLSNYIIGSKVIYNEKPLENNGKYFKVDDNTSFETKDSIITKIYEADGPELPSDEEIDKLFKEEDELILSLPISEFKGFDSDIFELIKKIDGELKNLDTTSIEKLKQEKNEINVLIKELQNTINEINKQLEDKSKLTDDRKMVIEADLTGLTKEKKVLEALIGEIDKVITKKPTSTTTPSSTSTTPVTNQNTNVNANVNAGKLFNYDDIEKLNEEFKKTSKGLSFRGVKLFGVDKKLADEVGNLDMSILENEDFAKQFESKERKEGVTALVKENYAQLVKIQLAAERMWTDSAGDTNATLKLKNTWARMVNDVKVLFSRYMFTDQVDPVKLKESAPDLEKINQDADKYKKSVGDQFNKEELINNKTLGLVNDFPKAFPMVGILKTLGGDYMYINDIIKINDATYPVLKIIGIINDINKLKSETDESKIPTYISYKQEDLAKRFGNTDKVNGGFKYVATYFIKFKKGKFVIPDKTTTEQTNQINLFNIYATDASKFAKINSDYVLYYLKDKENKNFTLLPKAIEKTTSGNEQGYVITRKLIITGALSLKDNDDAVKFGVKPEMYSPRFSKLLGPNGDQGLVTIMNSLR